MTTGWKVPNTRLQRVLARMGVSRDVRQRVGAATIEDVKQFALIGDYRELLDKAGLVPDRCDDVLSQHNCRRCAAKGWTATTPEDAHRQFDNLLTLRALEQKFPPVAKQERKAA